MRRCLLRSCQSLPWWDCYIGWCWNKHPSHSSPSESYLMSQLSWPHILCSLCVSRAWGEGVWISPRQAYHRCPEFSCKVQSLKHTCFSGCWVSWSVPRMLRSESATSVQSYGCWCFKKRMVCLPPSSVLAVISPSLSVVWCDYLFPVCGHCRTCVPSLITQWGAVPSDLSAASLPLNLQCAASLLAPTRCPTNMCCTHDLKMESVSLLSARCGVLHRPDFGVRPQGFPFC